MKKFESQLKEKAHLTKIRNAKKTVPEPGKHLTKGGSKKNGEQAQVLLHFYQNKNFNSIPAYKLLKTSGLQQYTRGFIERGYGVNLGKLIYLNEKDKNILYEDLKILPGHTVKLDKLISTLSKHSYEPSEYYNQSQFSSQIDKNSVKSTKQIDGLNGRKSQKISLHLNYLKESPEQDQKAKQDFVKVQSQFGESEAEYEKQLARVLNQYTPDVVKDKKKSTYDFSMGTSKPNFSHTKITSVGPNRKVSGNNRNQQKRIINQNSNTGLTGLDFKKKSNPIPPNSNKPTVKKSQTTIPNKASTSTSSNQQQNLKVLMKLTGQIQNNQRYNNCSTKNIFDLDLGVPKIRNLSQSFQGALMGSTIANIDIEELVFAFSGFVQWMIIAAPQSLSTNVTNVSKKTQKENEGNQSNNTHDQAFFENESIQDEVGNILRESYLHPLYRNEQIDEDIEGQEELCQSQGEEQIENEVNQFIQQKNCSVKLDDNTSNFSFLVQESYQFGVSQPLKIFDEPEPTQLDYFKPTIDSIANFIKNIVLAAKMQRQISIMAASYLQTFLAKSKLILTSLNYKRILVTVLLLSSKIWDDQSFESPSFARTFPEYTTPLLNEMEKQVLKVLDYKLKLDKKQYAAIFFKLRKFVRKNARSCQNKRLKLKQIRELQMGVKVDYKSNFMEKRNSF